ncbi:hypothetical protein N431DRAFT_430040 [Stipitochalara longipes BDJ]|nr:hypothetical protein N431DRAFT_430040 [Stipitochalara longipes BDJ]
MRQDQAVAAGLAREAGCCPDCHSFRELVRLYPPVSRGGCCSLYHPLSERKTCIYLYNLINRRSRGFAVAILPGYLLLKHCSYGSGATHRRLTLDSQVYFTSLYQPAMKENMPEETDCHPW